MFRVAKEKAPKQSLRTTALAMLARRDFAATELTQKLIDKGFERVEVESLVAEFVSQRFVDDRRYAESFVAYQSRRGQGPLRIRQDLRQSGVASEILEEALGSGPDFGAVARDVRKRKFGASSPKSFKDKAKQARFLQYRGFSNDHIRIALGSDPGEPFDPDV